jgi:hypothetical protein
MSEGNNLPLTPPEAEAYWCGRYLLELAESLASIAIGRNGNGTWFVERYTCGGHWEQFPDAPTLPEALEAAVKELKK